MSTDKRLPASAAADVMMMLMMMGVSVDVTCERERWVTFRCSIHRYSQGVHVHPHTCTPRAEKKIGERAGANLQGKVVSAPPGIGRVQFSRKLGRSGGWEC